jgi:phosphatidylethanolamine/phosphatidyl-N-methylethanolamine N-methyltransferase
MTRDLLLFVGQLMRNPREVSAVVPSSRLLAQAMVRELGPDTGRVVEFGPGTGKITAAILSRGVRPEDLTLYEMNPTFCAALARRFPGVQIVNAPAQAAASGPREVGAVVSGLPLLSMPQAVQHAIASAAFAVLRPGAPYIQFTYGTAPPLRNAVRAALGLAVEPGPRVWYNLPPARVYVYRRAVHHVCATMA